MYGGTKEEMERLIEDANKLKEANGEVGDLSIDSFADVAEAIHEVQEEMGIAYATADEAATTIEGSVNATKAAWDNLVTGLANGNANLGPLIDNLVSTASTAANNIIPVLSQALTGAATLIQEMVPVIMQEIPNFISETLPTLVESGVSIITAIIEGISQNAGELVTAFADTLLALVDGVTQAIPTIVEAAATIVPEVVVALAEAAPDLLESGLALIEALAQGIMDSIPTLIESLPAVIEAIVGAILEGIPMIIETGVTLLTALVENLPTIIQTIVEVLPEIITNITETLLDHIDEIIDAGVELLTALIENLPLIIETIITAMPEIVTAIVQAFAEKGPDLVTAGFDLFVKLIENLPTIIIEIVKAVPEIVKGIVDKFTEKGPDMIEAGRNLLMGIWNGINDKIEWLKGKVAGVVDKIKSWFEGPEGFDEHSPSKWSRKVFEYVMEGGALGIEDGLPILEEAIEKTNKVVKDGLENVSESMNESEGGFQALIDSIYTGIEDLDYAARLGIADAVVKSTDPSKGVDFIKEAFDNVEQMTQDLKAKAEAAAKEYADFEAGVMAEKEKAFEQLTKDKEAAIKSLMQERKEAAEEIFDQYGIFDEVEEKEAVSGSTLIENLKAQNEAVESFYSNLETLSGRGASQELVDMIADMGVGASAELSALVNMTDEELEEYKTLFQQKIDQAYDIGDMQLGFDPNNPEETFEAGIEAVEGYFGEKAEEIGKTFDDILAQSIASGIPDMIDQAVTAADEAAAKAQETLDSLYNEDMTDQQVLNSAHGYTRKVLTKHFLQFTPFADPDFHTMPAGWDPNSLEVRAGQWMSADRNTEHETTVNLVLPDGSKLAQYVFNPMVDYANANGTPIVNPQT